MCGSDQEVIKVVSLAQNDGKSVKCIPLSPSTPPPFPPPPPPLTRFYDAVLRIHKIKNSTHTMNGQTCKGPVDKKCSADKFVCLRRISGKRTNSVRKYASSSDVWLLWLTGHHRTDVISVNQSGVLDVNRPDSTKIVSLTQKICYNKEKSTQIKSETEVVFTKCCYADISDWTTRGCSSLCKWSLNYVSREFAEQIRKMGLVEWNNASPSIGEMLRFKSSCTFAEYNQFDSIHSVIL